MRRISVVTPGGEFLKKGAEKTDRRELECKTETVVVATSFLDEGSVGVVKVEGSSELSGGGISFRSASASGA